MNRKFIYLLSLPIIFSFFIYFGIGFYLADTILKIDPTCGKHEGSLPNTWSTLIDYNDYDILSRRETRKNFLFKNYHSLYNLLM